MGGTLACTRAAIALVALVAAGCRSESDFSTPPSTSVTGLPATVERSSTQTTPEPFVPQPNRATNYPNVNYPENSPASAYIPPPEPQPNRGPNYPNVNYPQNSPAGEAIDDRMVVVRGGR